MSEFHFLRPWWLLALVPCALLWWAIWHRDDAMQVWRGVIAPHLLPFLLQGEERKSRFAPLHLVAVGWAVSVIALAGPTWQYEPAPFADDTAALAIVVKVTPSMLTEDVRPSRLARSVQKMSDLLALRKGAKTALIAYAGTAHLVMPATIDGEIITTFAQSLDPKMMPSDGDVPAAALKLADQALAKAGSGSILWLTDSVAPEQNAALANWRKTSRTKVRILPAVLPGEELDALSAAARRIDADIERLAADDSDVESLARAAKFVTTGGDQKSDRWKESGYWLTPVLTVLLLPFYRRGWMIKTANQS